MRDESGLVEAIKCVYTEAVIDVHALTIYVSFLV